MDAGTPFKACRCCGATYTADQWAALPELGMQRAPWGFAAQLKNCTTSACTATLSLVLSEGEPSEAA